MSPHSLRNVLVVLLFASSCQSASPPGDGAAGTAPCGMEGSCVADVAQGHCSPGGHCVYPVSVATCAAGQRFATGLCVLAEPPAGCGCADDGNPCTSEFCADGACVHPEAYDGTGCAGGICHGGMCCQGCWDGKRCQAGTDGAACGQSGNLCAACPPGGSPPDPCHAYRCPGYCLAEPINGPGCPHCGSTGELCCVGASCDPGLSCVSVSCGEDCIMQRCQRR